MPQRDWATTMSPVPIRPFSTRCIAFTVRTPDGDVVCSLRKRVPTPAMSIRPPVALTAFPLIMRPANLEDPLVEDSFAEHWLWTVSAVTPPDHDVRPRDIGRAVHGYGRPRAALGADLERVEAQDAGHADGGERACERTAAAGRKRHRRRGRRADVEPQDGETQLLADGVPCECDYPARRRGAVAGRVRIGLVGLHARGVGDCSLATGGDVDRHGSAGAGGQ